MPPQPERVATSDYLHVTLGLWLGIYAFRAFVPTAVWNLSDTLPLFLKGALAIGVHLIGVAGCVLPITKAPNAARSLAFAVATISAFRQIFIGDDVIGSALSLLGWIVWLWWLAALAHDRRYDSLLVAAFACAFMLQVGMQAAWHGLDLPMARGALAVAVAIALSSAFAWTARAATSGNHERDPVGATRTLAVLGAAFFLELTLLANVGRVGAITGLNLVSSALLIQDGLLLGLIVTTFSLRSLVTYTALGVVVVVASLATVSLGSLSAVLLALAQAATVIALTASTAHRRPAVVRSFLVGMIGLFVLVFLFYNWYELPILWPVAAVLVAAGALPLRGARVAVTRRYTVLAPAGVLLTMIGLTGTRSPGTTRAESDGVDVLTYNIHQGFDVAGVPAMQHIADEIEHTNAGIIALQEVGRGWTFVGGADLVAYLRFRFPGYRVHFVPLNGQLWGVALLSRLPLDAVSGRAFDAPDGAFRYGVAEGTVRVGDDAVRVISVHLSAGLEGDGADARVEQVEQLLRFAGTHENIIIAGDLNTHPDEAPLQRIRAAGYRDAGAQVGLTERATWPAHAPNERIDYLLLKGRLNAIDGRIERTTASDHLPVFVKVAITKRDGTP